MLACGHIVYKSVLQHNYSEDLLAAGVSACSVITERFNRFCPLSTLVAYLMKCVCS